MTDVGYLAWEELEPFFIGRFGESRVEGNELNSCWPFLSHNQSRRELQCICGAERVGFEQSPCSCAHGLITHDFTPRLFDLVESRLGRNECALIQAAFTALPAKSRDDFRRGKRPDYYHRIGT